MNASQKRKLREKIVRMQQRPKRLRSDRYKSILADLIEKSKGGKKRKQSKRARKKYRSKYIKYLQSDAWAQLKIDIYNFRGRKCEKCGSGSSLQIHHLHYRNVFKEEPEDLIILCATCHKAEHGIK